MTLALFLIGLNLCWLACVMTPNRLLVSDGQLYVALALLCVGAVCLVFAGFWIGVSWRA